MHFLTYLPGIAHHRHIGCNHRRNTRRFGRIHNGTHQRNVIIIDNGIHRKIAFHTVLIAGTGYLAQVIYCKRIRRTGTHIQILDTEINRVRTCLDSGRQRFARAYRRHNFKITDRGHKY